ncbi:hypothetical protein GGE65_002679 [Skermanella aerolata]|uniref:hypothetical protein n=1 Tax=Skermanella aerolata TaxID=393310 RepID=UPI003D1EAEEF
MGLRSLLHHPVLPALCGVLLFSAVSQAGEPAERSALRLRLERAAESKTFGAESLHVAANLLTTEAFDAPTDVMPDLPERMMHPVETATGAAALADEAVGRLGLAGLPESLRTGKLPSGPVLAPSGLEKVLAGYAGRTADLLAKFPEAPSCCDPDAILDDIRTGGPTEAILGAAGGAETGAAARLLAPSFISNALALAGDLSAIQAGNAGERRSLTTPWGRILIGSAGDDHHPIDKDIILILDPAGNDTYAFSGPVVNSQLTILDLKGNDRYLGDSLAVRALVALIDLDGDDMHDGTIGAQGAALGGVALLLDWSGNDRYAARTFSQAAAAEGVAVLIDGAGDDSFEIDERGQAFGQVGGTALLWELGGNDRYRAGGPDDTLGRDARLSQAQGMGTGLRASHGGGIGVLRDDSGNDSYAVEMFGQGAGYFQGIGVLSDAAGDDRYDGVRYVQGAGVHGAIGLLADGGGTDSYLAVQGVGQGMGLDMGLGALEDDGGDDAYEAGSLAQGAGTANGMGFLLDGGGSDRFSLGSNGWGQDHAARGLPGPSFLIGADDSDRFTRGGEAVAVDPDRIDGPAGGVPYRRDPPGDYACPAFAPAPVPSVDPGDVPDDLTGLIRRSAPMHGQGVEAMIALESIGRLLPGHVPELLRAVPDRDFATAFSLLQAIRCHLLAASAEYRSAAWDGVLMDMAARHPASQPWLHARLMALSRPSGSSMQDGRLRDGIGRLTSHPSCAARSAALELARGAVEPGIPLSEWLEGPVRDALADPCLRLPAEALRLLDRIGDPASTARFSYLIGQLPKFLSDPAIRAGIQPPPG